MSPLFALGRKSRLRSKATQEKRNAFRLRLGHLKPLDASLLTRSGQVLAPLVHNVSAKGLCCQIFEPLRLAPGQPLTAILVLPLEESPRILKTEAFLVDLSFNHASHSKILRLGFLDGGDADAQETLHQFVMEHEFLRLKERQPAEYDPDIY